MDFKLLKPDFNALGKIEWAKPQVDTKNIVALVGTIAAALMVVFVFCPWFGLEFSADVKAMIRAYGESTADVTRSGITLWYGIIGLFAAIVALVGNLYNNKPFAFWGGAIGAVMGLFGLFMYASLTRNGDTESAESIKEMVKEGAGDTIRWGAILYFVCSLVAAATAFISVNNEKK